MAKKKKGEEGQSAGALYAGTFDPVTNGHIDIISRGAKIFGELVVAVSENPGKGPLFSVEERVGLLESATRGICGVTVVSFDGLLVDLARTMKIRTIIKGIRAVSDFEFEFQMALMNRRLAPEIETVYLLPSEQNTFISSRIVKEVSGFGGDISSMCAPEVVKALQRKHRMEGKEKQDIGRARGKKGEREQK